jgi:hypothetical protein
MIRLLIVKGEGDIGFKVPTALVMKSSVFWDDTVYSIER